MGNGGFGICASKPVLFSIEKANNLGQELAADVRPRVPVRFYITVCDEQYCGRYGRIALCRYYYRVISF